MIGNEQQQIEQNIAQARKVFDLGTSLATLLRNRDFKKVITEGYFEQEAVRLVHLKADPAMQNEASQKSIIAQMDAIGNLSQYFSTIQQLANMAGKSIEADEEALSELRLEEVQ